MEVFQEILSRYFHIGQREKGLWIFDHFHRVMLGHILPIEEADVVRARGYLPRSFDRQASHQTVSWITNSANRANDSNAVPQILVEPDLPGNIRGVRTIRVIRDETRIPTRVSGSWER